MAEIISFAERHNAKIRDRLMNFALNREAVILETRTGAIRADRLICRENAAEIVNSTSHNVVVGYGEIRHIRPAITPQISVINAHGDFVAPGGDYLACEPTRILAFARPGRRR